MVVASPPLAARSATSARILIFGDSHVVALQAAVRRRAAEGITSLVDARRMAKVKDGQTRGDTSFDEILDLSEGLGRGDLVVSAAGGNQHAIFSTIQHPDRFDFLMPGDDAGRIETGVELIPFRTLHAMFRDVLYNSMKKTVVALNKRSKAEVRFLHAPPPKPDNDFIIQHHDPRFAAANIASLGVSAPALRLRFWKLQSLVVEEICGELGAGTVPPPVKACDPEGFLLPHYFANDATHANAAYGDLILDELERLVVGGGRA